MKKTIPAVSIIIPMYNAEKYIGECLDSILAQTFTDYEVIVVDDCSTDNSRAVVQSYLPKFDGGAKLNLICLDKNSGNPSAPTNIGINISCGKYLYIIDNDDTITPTALSELYPIAKKFDADVVYTERYHEFGERKTYMKSNQMPPFVTEPTLITDNLEERTTELLTYRFYWPLWTSLIRRNFIIINDLKLLDLMSQDLLFVCCMILSGARYVRVPNVVNFYRWRSDSLFHKNELSNSAEDILQKRIRCLNEGFKYFDEFLSRREFFRQRPDVKNLALEVWVNDCVRYVQAIYAQIPAWKFDGIIRREFEKFNANPALTSFLFSRMNVFNVNLNRQGTLIQQMNAHLQKQNEVIQQLQAQLAEK